MNEVEIREDALHEVEHMIDTMKDKDFVLDSVLGDITNAVLKRVFREYAEAKKGEIVEVIVNAVKVIKYGK